MARTNSGLTHTHGHIHRRRPKLASDKNGRRISRYTCMTAFQYLKGHIQQYSSITLNKGGLILTGSTLIQIMVRSVHREANTGSHYDDVIMGVIASQIISLTIVYSIVYSDADQRKKTKLRVTKLRVTGLCAGNSPVTGEFPAQMASNAGNVSIWWSHHDMLDVAYRQTWKHPFLSKHMYVVYGTSAILFSPALAPFTCVTLIPAWISNHQPDLKCGMKLLIHS